MKNINAILTSINLQCTFQTVGLKLHGLKFFLKLFFLRAHAIPKLCNVKYMLAFLFTTDWYQ